MEEAAPAEISPFPAPLRLDGYIGWSWKLFRACFWRLITVFVGGVSAALLLHFGVVVFMFEVLDVGDTVQALALSFASQVTLSTVAGSFLAAIAAPVFVEQVAGRRAGADSGWRSVRPRLGHAVVASLYVAMPLLMLVLFLGQITQFVLLPAVLGPPILVHAIVWEQLPFRDAATRAKNLLTGHWGRVVSALLVLAVGPALVQLVVLGALGEVLPEVGEGDIGGSLRVAIAIALTTAPVWLFTAAAGTVAYLELRSRFEELDVARLETEGLEPPPRTAPSLD